MTVQRRQTGVEYDEGLSGDGAESDNVVAVIVEEISAVGVGDGVVSMILTTATCLRPLVGYAFNLNRLHIYPLSYSCIKEN